MQIILASVSPRRKELLAQICDNFQVVPSSFQESLDGLTGRDAAHRFASGKALDVARRFPDAIVIGADTVVSFDGQALGKPQSKEDAKRMLRMLSGRAHVVYTGVCFVENGKTTTFVDGTRVVFNVLSEELIERYVESGLPLDKAGAYGIQDGYPLVKLYEGSYTNVMGLPLESTQRFLKIFLKDRR